MPSSQTLDVATLPIPEKERYTYADYAELPESAPYELIAGSLVMAPLPTFQHQQVSLRLSTALFRYVEAHGSGTVVAAPMDVMLAEDTTVQPDLVYISSAQREIIGEQRIEGAPDLIAEILSPSTAHRDVGIKKRLYEQYGVREYWTLDPESQAVEVHTNTDAGFTQHARVVKAGAVASTVINGFEVDVANLF
ncbi:restriction endonuclease [Longimonas halophila]|uniref:Restriction endonuclease n=1 Tax=Longimonas halophila TaxID=1469170 RepID=A0A2H3P3K1_9BACT|nr:Uma2 family endonuclease [Longimonas halophila]PEN06002.1 restriction endonuclease [Longimonas halophila]